MTSVQIFQIYTSTDKQNQNWEPRSAKFSHS